MTARRLFAPLALAVLASPALAAADTPIGSLARPTPVRSWAGMSVLSVLEPGTSRYRLAVMRGTAEPRPLPGIASASKAFDADIGPGPGGAATIVFTRCRAGARCHLSRTTPAGGAERPIAGATSTDGAESAPTVWGRRLAFARTYAMGGSSRVYVRPLDAPESVRSTRLPGVPRRVCEDFAPCRAVTDGRVPELELRGTTLAQSVRFGLARSGICGAGQIRLVDVGRQSSRKVAETVCGLSGSSWVGLGLIGRQLLFARICPGDPAGCSGVGAIAYRYTPRDGSTETTPRPDVLSGFSPVDADHALEVREPDTRDGTCDNFATDRPRPTCELVLSGPLRFARR